MSQVKLLLVQLKDGQTEDRAAAAEKLCQLGEEARECAVELVRACGDQDAVSQWAVAALEDMGAPDPGMRDDLARLASATNELVGYWAITLIGRLEYQATPVIDSVVSAMIESPHLAVRQRAAWTLGKIGGDSESAVRALDQAAKSSDPRLARLAAAARPNFD